MVFLVEMILANKFVESHSAFFEGRRCKKNMRMVVTEP